MNASIEKVKHLINLNNYSSSKGWHGFFECSENYDENFRFINEQGIESDPSRKGDYNEWQRRMKNSDESYHRPLLNNENIFLIKNKE